MRFAPREAHLDCAATHTDDIDQAAAKLAEQAIPLLNRLGYAVFCIGRLRMDDADSRAIARALSEALRDVLVADGAPPGCAWSSTGPRSRTFPTGTSTARCCRITTDNTART